MFFSNKKVALYYIPASIVFFTLVAYVIFISPDSQNYFEGFSLGGGGKKKEGKEKEKKEKKTNEEEGIEKLERKIEVLEEFAKLPDNKNSISEFLVGVKKLAMLGSLEKLFIRYSANEDIGMEQIGTINSLIEFVENEY